MTTNELMLAKAFREAGFEQEKAENLAQSIFDAIRDNVATKSDLQVLRSEIKGDMQALRGDLQLAVRDLKIWTGSVLLAVFSVQLVLFGLMTRYLGH